MGQTVIKKLTVTNTGKTNQLFVSSATPSDPEYALSGTGTCGPIPVTVAPKSSCTLGISFTPNAVGAHSATLTISDNTATSPQQVTLSGTGVAALTTSSSRLSFGSVRLGREVVKSFSVTNHQTQAASLSESFSGTNAADFSITGGTCRTKLAPKTSCSLKVTFKPGALGTESAALSISASSDAASPHNVGLTGAGM